MGLVKRFYQSNRHVKLAIILAPLLSIGGYILAGIYLDDKIEARPGADKPLALQPGCHLLTDVCELLHREIAVNLAMEERDGRQLFYLSASTPVRGVLAALGDSPPEAMLSRGDPKKWVLEIRQPVTPGSQVKLVVSADKNRYFAEIPVEE